MRVPLTVNDFLYRAEAVSAYAAAVLDEPVQPAAPVRTTTYAELLTRVRGWALPATGVAEGDEGAGLAGGAATRASRAATPRAGETWPHCLDAALAVPVPRAGQADVPSPSGPSPHTARRIPVQWRAGRLQQHGHASMQASSAQLFALIAPFPRRWWRGLPRRVWCLDRAQGGQQRLSVEGDVEASEQADQGERAFDRVVPGDAEQVQSPVDAVLPGLGGDQ
jgi:hypothetical protein